ncbi:hypothetical protein HJC23_000123 [Cyclotella cryptica]|uniref:PI3K/PI4K catalytic domain-containing protein n=1 Tax=Cyclotella cryptica TaxID=29204 RepID=A0ABD3NYN2_9STRA
MPVVALLLAAKVARDRYNDSTEGVAVATRASTHHTTTRRVPFASANHIDDDDNDEDHSTIMDRDARNNATTCNVVGDDVMIGNNSNRVKHDKTGKDDVVSSSSSSSLCRRGDYLYDAKNGRISLPPEMRTRQEKGGATMATATTNTKDRPNNSGKNAAMKTTTSNIVDLDDTLSDCETDVNAAANDSLETVHVDDSSATVSNADHVSTDENEAETTTFRNDVRNDWVDAMFGRDFFPSDDDSSQASWRDIRVRQGEGAAHVGQWVTYGAVRRGGEAEAVVSTPVPHKSAGITAMMAPKTKSTPLLLSNSVSNLSFGGSLLGARSGSVSKVNADAEETKHSAANHGTERNRPKIGATISRIPLGLYVKSVSVHSEAYSAGISPGSILVDINGLGLLGETSHRAVERLWGYAGEDELDSSLTNMSNNNNTSSNNNNNSNDAAQQRQRRERQIQINTSRIEWAPCGNFGLIQRSHGLAAEAGVRRGCLVIAVNGVGLRSLDHYGCARELQRFGMGRNVVLTLGYTPASSRSGYYEEKAEKRGGVGGAASGVEVRPRPVEYSTAVVETFFACTAPSMAMVDDGTMNAPPSSSSSLANNIGGERWIVSELAAYVAAGRVLPPGKLSAVASKLGINESLQQQRRRIAANITIGPCPTIDPQCLLDAWEPLVSLVQSMFYQAAGCCETSYVEIGGPFRLSWNGNDRNYAREAARSPSECIRAIHCIAMHSSPGVAEQVFEAHLMQLLGVATCALFELETNVPDETNNHDVELSEKLLNSLIDVALNDMNLCQRLFFLLRAFIGSLEDQKVPHGHISEKAALSMKLLRYAQRRLSGRMFDKSECHEAHRHCSEGYPMSRESSSTSSFRKVSQQLDIAHSESSLGQGNDDTATGVATCPRPDEYPSQEANAASSSLSLEDADSGECMSMDNMSCQTPLSKSQTDESTIATNNVNNDGTKKSKKSKSGKKILQLLKGNKSKHISKKNVPAAPLPPSVGLARSLKQGSSFSFSNVFHKQSSSLQPIDGCVSPSSNSTTSPQAPITVNLTMSQKFENLSWILRRIDNTCSAIEKNLIKTFPQKMADLALFPWSASKESALASVTQSFRSELRRMNSDPDSRFPILNPVDSLEQLTSVDADECFILPSAHFPMLLCFNSRPSSGSPSSPVSSRLLVSDESRFDTLYRTKIEILALRSAVPLSQKANGSGEAYVVQCSVGGVVQESGASELYISPTRPSQREVVSHRWTKGNTLIFESSSNWGFPKTVSMKIYTISRSVDSRDDNVSLDDKGSLSQQSDMGCGFIDLCSIWTQLNEGRLASSVSLNARVYLFETAEEFDQHGDAEENDMAEETVEIQCRVSAEVVPAEMHPQKRLLLYKHGDDLRQELLAIQFIERCNQILKASGLDLKLKTFRCLPVGSQKGFIEWVSGTVPLSQLCQSTGSSSPGSNAGSRQSSWSKDSANLDESLHPSVAAEVVEPAEGIQHQKRSWCKYQALRGLCQKSNGMIAENPIQDFLRSAAYDECAPYFVKKDVMDCYVKSCAGYCVITYLLGVGDRHLDNILLHQNGNLLHCDYSFILGNDPKTYLPMRITEEMIQGFGGRDSDNFARFLSFTGAAFLTLRRHNNLHSLLSLIRNMVYSNMRDVSLSQPPEEAILAMRGRFRLDLNDDDALGYIEHVVEKSITSKMWRAVDVMHALGKHF